MKFLIMEGLSILERTPMIVSLLVKNLPDSWIFQNEGGETWNVFDVIGHYIHGEKTDWIPRMQIILGEGDKHFVPFDRFAQFKDSKGKTLDELLEEFARLRKENVIKLRNAQLDEAALSKKATHPELGEVSLSELLASWVVHDLTHICQIARVMAKQYEATVGPWKAYMGILNR
ncbi:MAG TPA: DinB family protein [Chitinophagaceae bacterium]|nr:DinB family protein [Chitinophagaceae bacterium]